MNALAPPTQQLVLASTSPYRKQLLDKLGLPFVVAAADIDESLSPNESAAALVTRLAEAKARAVSAQHPGALIIGSDQVAVLDDRIVGKPDSQADAARQLRASSGRSVRFLTGLCLLNTVSGAAQVVVEPFAVHFRTLADDQIARYLERERPYNCAGSFKSEGYGITLFRGLEGRDPNALVGLPLIALTEMLAAEGITLP